MMSETKPAEQENQIFSPTPKTTTYRQNDNDDDDDGYEDEDDDDGDSDSDGDGDGDGFQNFKKHQFFGGFPYDGCFQTQCPKRQFQ